MLKKIDFFFKKTITKMRWQELLAILILFLAFVFFRSERKEMSSILPQLHAAKTIWITAGILLTGVYVLLQAFMYMSSFRAVGVPLKFADALELFLKRNFLSVFLPAGGISSLAFTPRKIQRKNYDEKPFIKPVSSMVLWELSLFFWLEFLWLLMLLLSIKTLEIPGSGSSALDFL